MRIELRDSLEFLYADSQVAASPCRAVSLAVARGGTVAVNLLLNGLPPDVRVDLALTAAGKQMPGARWFRLHTVPVEENTGLIGFTEATCMGERGANAPNPHVARRAPFRVFDAMQPLSEPGFAAAAPTEALTLHLPLAPDAQTGARELALRVRAAGETAELRLQITVFPAVIPPSGAQSFRYTNWHNPKNIAERHGLEPWGEGHWDMLGRYAALMAHGRQNMFRCHLPDFFSNTAAGPELNRGRLVRMVRLFTAAGLHFIEGGHLARRQNFAHNAQIFTTLLDEQPVHTAEGNASIAVTARQLMEEIAANGWRGRWIQHAADEPNAYSAPQYRILCGIVRRHMPGIPLLDATCDSSLCGALDMWCPQVHVYEDNRDFFEAQRRLGDQVWCYTCCEPGGAWLNRLLDQELLRPALLAWAGKLFNLDGFLHWGLNKWQAGASPFERSVLNTGGAWPNGLPAGDTHIVYPGPDGPWSSVRLEAHREGFEDYELLRLLEARNPVAAAGIIGQVVRGFADYTRDVAVLRRARNALLATLAGQAQA